MNGKKIIRGLEDAIAFANGVEGKGRLIERHGQDIGSGWRYVSHEEVRRLFGIDPLAAKPLKATNHD